MKGRGWQLVKRWIFLLIASLYPGCHGGSGRCPDDINVAVEGCMGPYTSMTDAASTKQLFMGVDVEVVRSTCTALFSAVQCAEDLHIRCPDSFHHIDGSMAVTYNMFKLCHYPYLYEIYARHMNCYWRNSAYSEKCYEKFRAEIDPIAVDIGESSAVSTMCSEYTKLVSCVQTNVMLQCNSSEAGELVESLVGPSVQANSRCTADSTEAASRHRAVPTTPDNIADPDRHRSGNTNQGNGNHQHNAVTTSLWLSLAVITLWTASLQKS